MRKLIKERMENKVVNFVGLNKVDGQKYRNGNNGSYRAPNEVIPKRGERSRFESQFRLKNHLI